MKKFAASYHFIIICPKKQIKMSVLVNIFCRKYYIIKIQPVQEENIVLIFMIVSTPEEKGKAERLYCKYKNLMYKEAYDILESSAKAEDAIHTSFVKILKNLEKLNEEEEARTRAYIMTVLKNTAIDMYNKEKGILSPEELHEEIADSKEESNPEIIVVSRENSRRLTEAIMQLPPKYKDLIIMKYARGHSNEEISGLLEISAEAVKKRITRAKKLLSEALKREGII